MPEKRRDEQIMVRVIPIVRRTTLGRAISVGMAALAACLLTACSLTADRERSSVIARAQQDHAICQEEGHQFPSRHYTWCRQSLQDERERRALRGQAMVDRDTAGLSADDPLFRPTTRRGDFRCEERQTGDTGWIECRVFETR